MHVCHISTEHSAYEDRIYHKECWSIHDWADKITVIARGEPAPDMTYPGIEVLSYPSGLKLRDRLSYLGDLAANLQADIYHLHNPELLLLSHSLRKRTEAALLYDLHAPHPEFMRTFSDDGTFSQNVRSFLLGIGERTALTAVDGLIFPSFSLYESMHHSARFSTILYDFPRLEFFPQTNSHDSRDFTIIYKGPISEPHGLLYLIQAFYHFYRREQHGRLHIIGDIFPPEFEHMLRYTIKYFSLSHAVTLEPSGEDAEIAETMASASVGVSALLPRPFFRKTVQSNIFEYMAMGIPVVAGHFPSAYQFIHSPKAGVVLEESTPYSIAEALSFLYNHQQERTLMGERGKALVQKEWRWDHMKSTLQQFYSRVHHWRQTMGQ